MSDLIERQAAIDAYGDWYVEEGTADGFIGTVKQLLEGLPSAQPEPSEITDEQAILHLQSTGWMQNHDREMYESGLRKQLADDSESYNSLIPCEDTISRQVAIDALDCINGAEEVLRALPPAKPEKKTGMWLIRKWGGDAKCSNCGHRFNDVYDTENHDRYCRFCGSKMLGLWV